jgi:enoyl-CoA hydratase
MVYIPAMSEWRAFRVLRDGPVAEVVLIGPGKGNTMGPDFWRELPQIMGELDRDPEVRAVLIAGDGKHFSYGLDLPAMMTTLGPVLQGDGLAAVRTKLLGVIAELQASVDSVARCRKPVIAAVSGWCIGGGLDLIAACDVRLCAADARFSLREVKVAMVADIGSLQRLPRIIGQGNTRELALTGKDIDAARAQRMGLVGEVYPTRDELLVAARAMAAEMAGNPPLVVQGIKQVLDYCEDKSTADGLRYVAVWNAAFLQSVDLGEAMTAFMERRPPKFQGR